MGWVDCGRLWDWMSYVALSLDVTQLDGTEAATGVELNTAPDMVHGRPDAASSSTMEK